MTPDHPPATTDSVPGRLTAQQEYTVDALAEAAGVTVRNVRAYQDKGLLAPPVRRGRIGVYFPEHLARLKLIGQLLERGYSIASIRELLDAWSTGQGLAQVLGLEEAMRGQGREGASLQMTLLDLQAIFGAQIDENVLRLGQSLGVLEINTQGFLIKSPRLLTIGIKLFQAGLPLGELMQELVVFRGHTDHLSAIIVQLLTRHLICPESQGGLPLQRDLEPLRNRIQILRPLVEELLEIEMARALSKAADQELVRTVTATVTP